MKFRTAADIRNDLVLGLSRATSDVVVNQLCDLRAVLDKNELRDYLAADNSDEILFGESPDSVKMVMNPATGAVHEERVVRNVFVQRVKLLERLSDANLKPPLITPPNTIKLPIPKDTPSKAA